MIWSSRQFFGDMCNTWERSPEAFHLWLFGVRSDATNSGIWQKRKLQALELIAMYLDTDDLNDASATFDDKFIYQKRLSDIQPVEDGRADGLLALLKKQLHALGCPTWWDFGDASSKYPQYVKQVAKTDTQSILNAHVCTY